MRKSKSNFLWTTFYTLFGLIAIFLSINSTYIFQFNSKAQLIYSIIFTISTLIIYFFFYKKLKNHIYKKNLIEITNNLPGISYKTLHNKDRTIIFISKGVLDIFGYTELDFQKKMTSNLNNAILDVDKKFVIGKIKKSINENKTFEVIYRIKDTDNNIKWVMDKAKYYKSSNEIQGFITDITELKSKENQLIQAQKMETIGTLANGLAHDFNNVLGGITGTLSLLKFKIKKNNEFSNEKIIPYLSTIEDSTMKAADLIKQLLSLSRKEETTIETIDLNISIKHIVQICKNSFDKSIEIFSNNFDKPAYINADMSQIEQVLLNLAINSLHAMTSMRSSNETLGGVLSITTQKIISDKYFKTIHPDATSANYYIISITDTGIGIEDEQINKIFDPFFSTKDNSVATGLGLTMSYNIIKSHNGFIEVYSKKNVSTTFQIFLPAIKESEIIRKISPLKDLTIPTGVGLILVVDDEETMRQTASGILEECGYKVLFANNGQEALDIYKQNQNEIKLILLDMVMPVKSGKDTLFEIRKIDKNIKIIMTSGFKLDQTSNLINKKGANDFLQKPYTLLKLAKIVDATLN